MKRGLPLRVRVREGRSNMSMTLRWKQCKPESTPNPASGAQCFVIGFQFYRLLDEHSPLGKRGTGRRVCAADEDGSVELVSKAVHASMCSRLVLLKSLLQKKRGLPYRVRVRE